MPKCVFCEVASGDSSAVIVAETEGFLAIENKNPYVEGHILIIPKSHHSTSGTFSREEKVEFFEIFEMVCRKLEGELGAEGIRWWSNKGEAAGQTVEHMHFHVLPFYKKKIPGWLIRAWQTILRFSAQRDN